MAAVEVDGCKRALDAYLKGLEEAASASIAESLEVAATAGRAAVERQTKRHTGGLLGGFVKAQTSPFVGTVFNSKDYAGFVDRGTKAHTIRAKNTQFLRFQVGGQTLFRRVVNHPGTHPRPIEAPMAVAGELALSAGLQRRADILAENFNK